MSFNQNYNTHTKFINNYSSLAEAAKTKYFSTDTIYNDCRTTLYNYLRQIHDMDGVTLCSIIRDNDLPYHTPRPDFIKGYIFVGTLNEESYNLNNKQISVIVVTLEVNNTQSKTKESIYGKSTLAEKWYNHRMNTILVLVYITTILPKLKLSRRIVFTMVRKHLTCFIMS